MLLLFCTNGGMKIATFPSICSRSKVLAAVLSNRQYDHGRLLSFPH